MTIAPTRKRPERVKKPKSQVRVVMERVKEKEKLAARPRKQKVKDTIEATTGYCGGNTQGGGKCRMPAGMGTNHSGEGRCRLHGGNTPTHSAKAAKGEAILMGAPKDINPIDALMWCIRLTAGEVEFCTTQMEVLEQSEWLDYTIAGKQLNVWAKERQNAVDRLARFSHTAISLGIAERAVRVAEMYGHSISKLLRGILEDLELNDDQLARAPHIVRKHLILLEGSRPLTDAEREAQPRMPRRVPELVASIPE